MAIQAISIPQKIVPLSRISIDQDLDLGALHALKANTIYRSTPAGLDILAQSVDALIKSQYFTVVDAAGVLHQVTSDTWTNATAYTKACDMGHIPVGAVSGTFGFAVTLAVDTDGGVATCYARVYNATKAAYIGAEMTHNTSTPTLKWTSQLLGAALSAGDVIEMHYHVNNAAYAARVKDPYVRGTATYTFQAGTLSWS